MLDTADIYAPTWDSMGHNEEFVAEALRTWSGTKEQKAKVVIATKGGITRGEGETWGRNGSLDYLVAATERSMEKLGVDKIDLWQHHRLDPSIDFETQFENVLELKVKGLVDQIGVSNYDAQQLRIAIDIAGTPAEGGVVSVQNEFSPRYRHDLDVLEVCEEHEITFLPWSPLGGVRTKSEIAASAFEEVGNRLGASPFAVALAWEMRYSSAVLPIPGATRAETVLDCVSATELKLSDEDFEYLSSNLPPQAEYSSELTPKPAFR